MRGVKITKSKADGGNQFILEEFSLCLLNPIKLKAFFRRNIAKEALIL